jgi:hypothetical protein
MTEPTEAGSPVQPVVLPDLPMPEWPADPVEYGEASRSDRYSAHQMLSYGRACANAQRVLYASPVPAPSMVPAQWQYRCKTYPGLPWCNCSEEYASAIKNAKPTSAIAKGNYEVRALFEHPAETRRLSTPGTAGDGVAGEADHIPASPEMHAAVDAALGLRETPPIRLSVEVYECLEREAAERGLVLQAYIRLLIEAGLCSGEVKR